MAIEVLKEKEKQTFLVFVFIIVLALALFVIFWGVIKNKGVSPSPVTVSPFEKAKVGRDFIKILQNPVLKELKVFEEPSLPQEKGRENPFLPYGKETLPPAPPE